MRLLRHPRRLPALALVALVAWLAALLVAPATLPPGTVDALDGRENRLDHLDRWLGLPPFHALVYGVGDILCHQKAWRSFEVNGNQLPIDERMTAIFAAAAPALALTLALPVGPYVSRSLDAILPPRWRSANARRAARKWALVVVLALLPAALDVAWENILLHESNALARVLTGSLAGLAGGLVLGAFLASVDHVFGARLGRLAPVAHPLPAEAPQRAKRARTANASGDALARGTRRAAEPSERPGEAPRPPAPPR